MLPINQIIEGDCLEVMKGFPDSSIDLCATDAPYGISFMRKRWDIQVPSVEIWQEVLRVLKDGAFLFSMSSPRQDVLSENLHNIREAGFDTNFTSIYWCYSHGFPKAMNVSKAVDKRGGHDPDDIRSFKNWYKEQLAKSSKTTNEINAECGFTATSYSRTDGKDYWTSAFPTPEKWTKIKQVLKLDDEWDWIIKRYDKERGYLDSPTGSLHLSSGNSIQFSGKQLTNDPYTEQAKSLNGSYAGFQPKPAVEVVIVAMKPLSEKTYVDQALKNSKGITWLDDGRIPFESTADPASNPLYRAQNGYKNMTYPDVNSASYHVKYEEMQRNVNPEGRFPANLLVSDDALNDGKITISSGGSGDATWKSPLGQSGIYGEYENRLGSGLGGYGDSGSFSCYFSLDTWWTERIKKLPENIRKTFPFLIEPKADSGERNEGLNCAELIMKSIREEEGNPSNWDLSKGKVRARMVTNPQKNFHPSVKPIKLMSYLITLGSRENDIVLDPFIGSGTTGIAARFTSRDFIGIEKNPEYITIARARIQPWLEQTRLA
ncbi:MAG: site-specific DNA-methyltransferase [Patescibacteria group bacterium]|nr:site-specific DNA-methyltransferase [Patescibacteria group bacterium]